MHAASRVLLAGRSRLLAPRRFHVSARRLADAVPPPPLPAKKPMGSFRGGLFGFLLGCVVSGGAVYSYVLGEYKAANEMLVEDVYALQASVTRLASVLQGIEEHEVEQKK